MSDATGSLFLFFQIPKVLLMREAGRLPNEAQARAFADHLLAAGIDNQIDLDQGEWVMRLPFAAVPKKGYPWC